MSVFKNVKPYWFNRLMPFDKEPSEFQNQGLKQCLLKSYDGNFNLCFETVIQKILKSHLAVMSNMRNRCPQFKSLKQL